MTLEPVPESRAALGQLEGAVGRRLLTSLRRQAAQARELVPACVGVSVGALHHDVTFTLVSTDEDAATLDGVQYVDDGPCVAAIRSGATQVYTDAQLFDEDRWQLFSQVTAAAGVRSSLTLPVLVDGDVAGSVSLYASSSDAFDGHHEALAGVFDAWAPGAVRNADLAFNTRRTAGDAADILRDDRVTALAVAVIATQRRTDPATARSHLEDSARRAGVSATAFARFVLEAAGMDDQP